MPLPQVVTFGEWSVNLCARGPSAFIKPDFSRVEKTGDGTIVWDPGIAGLLGSVGVQNQDSDHRGERHLDGDELLYVISGAMRLVLLEDDGTEREVPIHSGEAVLVPACRWHRLRIDSPATYVSFGGGRTEIRGASG